MTLTSKMDDLPTLWIGTTNPEDPARELARTRFFLAKEPAKTLKEREDEAFKHPIKQSLIIRCQTEETVDDRGDFIRAHVVAFDQRFDGSQHELGNVKVLKDAQGMHMQQLLMRIAVIKVIEQDIGHVADDAWQIFAVVAKDNDPSWRSIEAIGMIQPPDEDPVWKIIDKDPDYYRNRGYRLYVLPKPAIATIKADMSAFAANPVLTKGGQPEFRVRFGYPIERYGVPAFYLDFDT